MTGPALLATPHALHDPGHAAAPFGDQPNDERHDLGLGTHRRSIAVKGIASRADSGSLRLVAAGARSGVAAAHTWRWRRRAARNPHSAVSAARPSGPSAHGRAARLSSPVTAGSGAGREISLTDYMYSGGVSEALAGR
jgi:hypothetical protein